MPNNESEHEDDSLVGFVEDIVGPDSLRIEEDFGHGFVRLKSSEAEKRQAAQDIRSSEDAIIELLRNSRDAGANNIYVATGRVGDKRSIIVIDDGAGIPEYMRELVFQPRITSKLDSAHMDKWGLHGRGMALFSIAENSIEHKVIYSSEGNGTSIKISLSLSDISEKTDQSTFPYFEIIDGVLMIRGPKNIQRMICEFAIENRSDLKVYVGSNTEIAATLYEKGTKSVPAKERIFSNGSNHEKPAEMISFANDPYDFMKRSSILGLDISERSARRVLDGEIAPLEDIFSKVEQTIALDDAESNQIRHDPSNYLMQQASSFNPRITKPDISKFEKSVTSAFNEISNKYFLEETKPKISIRRSKLIIEFELIDKT